MDFIPLLIGAVLLGLGIGAGEVSAVTLLQLAVPDGMRGKILGLIITANAIGYSIGAWIAGRSVEAQAVGTLLTGATACVAALALTWLIIQARGSKTLDALADTNAPVPAE